LIEIVALFLVWVVTAAVTISMIW